MTLEIDEKKIMERVLQGLNKKEIESELVQDLIAQAKTRLSDHARGKINDLEERCKQRYNDTFRAEIKEIALKHVKSKLTPQKIHKMLVKDTWENWLEDTVGKVLADYVEMAIGEWLTFDITIGTKNGKKKTVSVVGTDSYEYRKKR